MFFPRSYFATTQGDWVHNKPITQHNTNWTPNIACRAYKVEGPVDWATTVRIYTSQYFSLGSPTMFAKKKDGTHSPLYRLPKAECCHCQEQGPPPRIDDLFYQICGARCFSKIDFINWWSDRKIFPRLHFVHDMTLWVPSYALRTDQCTYCIYGLYEYGISSLLGLVCDNVRGWYPHLLSLRSRAWTPENCLADT